LRAVSGLSEKSGRARTLALKERCTFPMLPEFQQATLEVLCREERGKRLVIKDAEVAA
jgi:hypothetical protein